MPLASIGDSFSSFFDAVGDFAESVGAINWFTLLLGMAVFVGYLSLRARASFNILRAAYPGEAIDFKHVWGAYLAGYGFNSVVPARGGDVVRLFLTKTSVPNSSYPAVASSFFVEQIFDLTMAVPILLFAFTQGAFPKPPDFSKLPAFDLAFFASHPRFTLFLLTVMAIGALIAFALLSARVPFTPGGAGVQQALLVKVFAGTAAGATVAAYSVGQQIAIGATTFACGFAAIVFIFRFRSFKEVIAAGREARTAPAEPRAPA